MQERALRIIFDNLSSSYETLCERALSVCRFRFLGIEMYIWIKK